MTYFIIIFMSQKLLKLYRLSLYISIHLLFLTVFPISTIVMFWATILIIKFYFKLKISKLVEKGLVIYLPQKLQKQLLERSLFDIMCDIWFMQETNILKVFLKPFFVTIQPAKAVEVLNDLDPNIKKTVLRKGCVNILPQKIKNWIIPPIVEQIIIAKREKQLIMQSEKEFIKKKMILSSDQNSQTDQTKSKHNNKKMKTPIIKKQFMEEQVFNRQVQSEFEKKNVQERIVQTQLEIKEKQVHKWDRLQLYNKFKSKFNSQQGLMNIIKRNLGIVKKLVQLQKISLKNIQYKSLIKIILFFLVLLLVQFKLNKKSSKLIKDILNIVLVIFSVLGIISTAGIMAYKITNSDQPNILNANSQIQKKEKQ